MTKLTTWQATIQDDDTGAAVVSPVVTVRLGGPAGGLADLFDIAGSPIANPITGGVDGFVQFQVRPGRYWVQAADGGTFSQAWYVDVMPDEGLSWETRAELVSDWAAGMNLPDGAVLSAGGFQYEVSSADTGISDMVGVKTFGPIYADHFGANTTPGTTDMTAAIQAAIDYVESLSFGVVNLTASDYFVSSTLTIRDNNVYLIGKGKYISTLVRSGDYGDTLNIASSDPATTRLSNIEVRAIGFDMSAEMNSGSHIKIRDVILAGISDVYMKDGFGSIDCEGLQVSTIQNIDIKSGTNFVATKVGSFFVRIKDANNPANETGELRVLNVNATRTGSTTTPIDVGLDIQAGDGLWFSDCHFFGAQDECTIHPQTGTTQLQGVHFTQCWFDQNCDYCVRIFDTSTGGYGDFSFNGCRGLNAGVAAFSISGTATNLSQVKIEGGDWSVAVGASYVFDLNHGFQITMTGTDALSTTDQSALTASINVGGNVRRFQMTGGQVGTTSGGGNSPVGIDLNSASGNYNISGVQFHNVDEEITASGALRDGSSLGVLSSTRANVEEVSAVADTSFSASIAAADLNPTGATTVNNLNSVLWNGRQILWRVQGATVTFSNTAGNIRSVTGSDLAVPSGSYARTTYQARQGVWVVELLA